VDLHKYLRRLGTQANRLLIILLISLASLLSSRGVYSVAQAKPLPEASPQIVVAQTAPIYGVEWGSHNTPSSLGTGLQIPVTITLTNTGSLTWPKDGDNAVYLSYHWLDSAWQVVVWDGLRTTLPKDVSTGQSVTLSASLKAPSTVGNYNLRWDLVRENVTWFSYEGTQPLGIAVSIVVPPTYGVQWGSSNTPASLGNDLQVPVTITVTNAGSMTWHKEVDNPVYISYHWFKNSQVVVWDGLRTALPNDLASGESATIIANLKTPSELGNYSLKWDLVREKITWFSFEGAQLMGMTVSVITPPKYGVLWSNVTTPINLFAGKYNDYPKITLTNIGSLTWSKNENVYLSYHLYKDGKVVVWDGKRIPFYQDVAPGQSVSYWPGVDVPVETGEYALKWDLVHEKVTWFSFQGVPTADVTVSVVPPFYGAELTNNNMPANIAAGQQITVSFIIKNFGYFMWPKGGDNPVYLEYYTYNETYSYHIDYSPSKIYIPQDVAPGQTVTVQAPFQTPVAPGIYIIRWSLRHGNAGVIRSLDIQISVTPSNNSLQWGSHSTPASLQAFQVAQVPVTITNTGLATWPKASDISVYMGNSIALSYKWYKDGKLWSSNSLKTFMPQDVAPGQTITLQASVEGTSPPGDYTLKWDMVQGKETWFSSSGTPTLDVPVTISPITYGVQWGSYQPPTLMKRSGDLQVPITVTNTGTFTWYKGGLHNVYLTYRWFKDESEYVDAPLPTNLPQDVAPGQTVTLMASLKYPASPVGYTLKWDLMHYNVGRFSAKGVPTLDIVTPPPKYGVAWMKPDDISNTPGVLPMPNIMISSEQIKVTHVITNTGSMTWPNQGDNQVFISYHWYKDGKVVVWDGLRTKINGLSPGNYGWFVADLKAPSELGTYTLQWDLVHENVTWFSFEGSKPLEVTVSIIAPPPYAVQWGDYKPISTTLSAGQSTYKTFTVTNIGSMTWPKGGDNPVYISYHWYKDGKVIVWDGWRTVLPQDIALGQSVAFNISYGVDSKINGAAIKAPPFAGTYTLKWDMVQENVTWFSFQGASTLDNPDITVQTPFYGVDLVSHDTPASLDAGKQATISLTLMNVGSFTWPKGGNNPVHLSYEMKALYSANPPYSMFTVYKAALLSKDVATGQAVTLQVPVIAPTIPGKYNMRWYLTHEGVGIIGEFYTQTTVASPTYGVQWGNHNTPVNLQIYQNVQVPVTVTNTSSIAWLKWGMSLSYSWFMDGKQMWWSGSSPLKTTLSQDILIGQSVTLQASLEAPPYPGTYTLKWDMAHEGVTLFSQKGVPTLDVVVLVADITYGVQWGSHNTPTKLTTTQTADVSITVKNTGNFTWPKGGNKPVYLYNRWFFNDGQGTYVNAMTYLPQDVSPGQTVTIQAKLSGPIMPGNYTIKWDLRHEGVGWFSAKGTPTLDVNITPPTYWAKISTSQGPFPATLGTNQEIKVNIAVYNYGSLKWLKGGDSPVYLSYHWFKDGQVVVWDGLKTLLWIDVVPGSGGILLSSDLLVPSVPGNYTLVWDLVQEGVTWFSVQGVPTYNINASVTT